MGLPEPVGTLAFPACCHCSVLLRCLLHFEIASSSKTKCKKLFVWQFCYVCWSVLSH